MSLGDRDWLAAPWMRSALAALGVSTLLAGWSLVRWLAAGEVHVPPTRGDALALPAVQLPVADAGRTPAPVEDDLFAADRTAPDPPYALPGEELPAVVAGGEAPTPRLLGTALSTDGDSFATARLGDGAPRILRVGDTLGPFRLRAIARNRVTFTSATGERIDVRAGAPPASQ